jgi:hypothetical protein
MQFGSVQFGSVQVQGQGRNVMWTAVEKGQAEDFITAIFPRGDFGCRKIVNPFADGALSGRVVFGGEL